MNSINRKPFFCSWSGGKDSCLALQRVIHNGGIARFLLTILREDGQKSHSHGLPLSLLHKQAKAMQIPLVTQSATWENYTAIFSSAICQFKDQGIEYGVFGDIDIDDHRQWCQDVCREAGIVANHPLWQNKRNELLAEFLRLDYKAMIIAVKQEVLGAEFLGKTLTQEVIVELIDAGIDPSGENGEYHTVVTDGPIFSSEIKFEIIDREFHDGYWFLNVS